MLIERRRRRLAASHPRHAAGADRRPHRPPSDRTRSRCSSAASVLGRVFWNGALEHLSPDVDGSRGLARRPRCSATSCSASPARRSPASPRTVQARADPRGRIRGHGEARAGASTTRASRSGSRSERATSSSRSAPTTSTRPPSSSPSSRERRREDLAREDSERARQGRRSCTLARVVSHRAQAASARGRARPDHRTPLRRGSRSLAARRLHRRRSRDGRHSDTLRRERRAARGTSTAALWPMSRSTNAPMRHARELVERGARRARARRRRALRRLLDADRDRQLGRRR